MKKRPLPLSDRISSNLRMRREDDRSVGRLDKKKSKPFADVLNIVPHITGFQKMCKETSDE